MSSLNISTNQLRSLNRSELNGIIQLAIGRIFRLGARKTQPGDIEQYEQCKQIIMEASNILNYKIN